MKDIRTLSLDQLKEYFVSLGEKPFRAKQVYDWLWSKNLHSIDEMTNLSKPLREKIALEYTINPVSVDLMQKSTDGTIKNGVKLHDNLMVESVLIPTETRTTACVSSQVGCSLNCEFCATAKLKRMRNLEVAEIVDQVALIDRQSRLYFDRPLSNIVFMGMGEPMMNYKNVVEAIHKITKPEGLGMSPRRITVSTSGIPKMIKMLADEELKVKLALSLHSAIEHKRNEIMPFSDKFPLTDIMEALQYWYQKNGSVITFEYCVWKGINDGDEDIKALIKYCRQVPSKVNLIQYNPIGEGKYDHRSIAAEEKYVCELEKAGITVMVRKSRGGDIDAACGQLANKTTASEA
ncbi:23S rRNA (adenine(2503)-C(2))-methyltransferase RlmN [Elizabethkingia meningoseptica]|uniref:23S rRNA (adenine(2503)-C(2))-methyltransferase RlmN n=1 Tax=Elizabethkingia meningoseptica TaxID=238 RepID=UPI000332CE46|nr:23S rRNA (adenine(2503)-C(2))-methyltransferase RlmN [Elizabethkingia meningoseptica]AQX05699.1 23S rRNA (adenine(2503)-C(2))-methyltransferase [Elizabethkingia meningoseptica]AQX47742.1 23S rRNA (adenine(2503)-C2)-methyltransferase [Elizabethkingia meningoseptica]EOR30632.1 ribosomal RNA large subunit methyltransferase N [Elizabethkingia meningoseptica ATCC 13253 = NBRC 12535]KUY23995.1 23S rRNA (adenine(2503)-C2)-methyltransferase [Elizabethkingia meningoseptica]MDE5437863.1 23S rRNA (ade